MLLLVGSIGVEALLRLTIVGVLVGTIVMVATTVVVFVVAMMVVIVVVVVGSGLAGLLHITRLTTATKSIGHQPLNKVSSKRMD